MKFIKSTIILTGFVSLLGCGNKLEDKGFRVEASRESTTEESIDGISSNSSPFETRPSSVLLTGIPQYRLTTIYKVNYNRDSTTFIGSNAYHFNYDGIGDADGNQWNNNYMPGFEAVYGYNMVNVSHYDAQTQTRQTFFESPVLIKTFYYPSFSKDTLNHQPVNRNYFMTSVYDDDTNKDGYVNVRDLRRLYYFDNRAKNRKPLIPTNYSAFQSEYDPANDFMFVFAKLDENGNGQSDDSEDVHIFWIDLSNPEKTGRQY